MRLALAVLALVAVALWALVPTYPNYDAYYHLAWGRELLDGVTPSFEAYQAPTEHPLYLAFCAVLGLMGESADRALVLFTALSHVAFAAGVFRLGETVFGRTAGILGALFAASSFALLLYAARAYVDVPFLALVVWAAVLEAQRPRRGAAVLGLLAVAGLLRPEAWVLAGFYWLWLRDLRLLPLAAVGPLVWAAVDFAVTGDPLFSLHATSDLADELNRDRGLEDVPVALVEFLGETAREPVAVAGVLGMVLAWRSREDRTRALVVFALFAAGVLTFVATAAAGLSVLPRYLTIPAVALCLFAGHLIAVGLARNRRLTLGVLAVGLLVAVPFLPSRVERLSTELHFVSDVHDDLEAVLATDEVRVGLACGPLTFPNYRLVPDARWILDLGRERVGSRSAKERDRGVALFLLGDKTLRRYGFADGASPRTNVPGPGFVRGPIRGRFVAYVSCP